MTPPAGKPRLRGALLALLGARFLGGPGLFGAEAFHPSFFTSSVPFTSVAPKFKAEQTPKLILIGGAPGTGKSTFGMSVALDQGILKCISTDTVRAVMRSFVAEEVSPALHRSSYDEAFEGDDPVRSWRETCAVLKKSVEGLVDDAIQRKVGLVVEGVHVVPSPNLIQKWEEAGGVAVGCLLQVSDPSTHKKLLKKRGYLTGNTADEERKICAYGRIRAIQEEMTRLADESGWLRIEQLTAPDPLEMVTGRLVSSHLQQEQQRQPWDISEEILRAANVPMIEQLPHLAEVRSAKKVRGAKKKARV